MKRLLISLAVLATAQAGHAQSWTNRFGWFTAGPMTLDANGNIIVAGGAANAQATVKFSNLGVPLWTNYYNGRPGEYASSAGVTADTNGNVFVICHTWPENGDPSSNVGDYLTLKYSSTGQPLWTNRYDVAGYPDYAGSLVVDGSGNVIVTGASRGLVTDEDWTTIKISSAGVLLWDRHVQSPFQDQAWGVSSDSSDNVIVSGMVEGVPRTIKYSSSGSVLWTNNFGGSVAVDSGGNVFESDGAATVKYSSSGAPLWTNLFGGRLVLDANGDVIVRGVESNGTDYDSVTIKSSNSGVPLWTNRYRTMISSSAFVAVDANRNVLLTANVGANWMTQDWVTIKYSVNGMALWTNLYSGPVDGPDEVWGLGMDNHGNTFVVGNSWNTPDSGCVLIKYAAEIAPPVLEIQRLGNNVVLSWTNAAFGLQSAPAVTGTFTNVPGATSPYTNVLSGGQLFFRLVQ